MTTQIPDTAAAHRPVTIENIGAAGVITLSRPAALNALNDVMRADIDAAYRRFARDPNTYAVVMRAAGTRAFCAGGDIKALVALAKSDFAEAKRVLADEYRLNWLLDNFSKPTLPLINGAVMGSGVGLTAFGTHKIAGENYSFSMPETAIGFFPDVGAACLFARLPWPLGLYLGLTGRSLDRFEAFALGLVTHVIDSAHFDAITAAVGNADPVDPLLDGLNQVATAQMPADGIARDRALIERYFGGGDIWDIMTKLKKAGTGDGGWPKTTLDVLQQRSPLALAVTDRHIREARTFDLRGVLQRDYRLAVRFLIDPDFAEGVRAMLVDKDKAPNWSHGAIHEVTSSDVDRYFAWTGKDELVLPTRAKMQEART